jgi:hypothetical protein
MARMGYSAPEARGLAGRLGRSDPAVRAAFWRWWLTGYLDRDQPIAGYPIRWLLEQCDLVLPAAFGALDYLLGDPERAGDALKLRFDCEDLCAGGVPSLSIAGGVETASGRSLTIAGQAAVRADRVGRN